jgi:hypothetical protein
MAVESLFNASRESLLKRVRINKADDEATLALVDMAISEVRTGFYSSLGASRIAQILAGTVVENPTSAAELLRATAANTEALWVTWLLAPRLPYLFMDNKASVGDAFNDEPLTRDSNAGQKRFLDNLKAQVDVGLSALKEPAGTEAGLFKASSIGPDSPDLVFDRFRGLYPAGHSTQVGLI